MVSSSRRLLVAGAVVCLLVSGAAGLVYQIVWMRYLALVLGHTSYAIVAVLVAFMGGLALGNAWFGAWADRVERPLVLYAVLEIGIGLYALVFPSYYEWVQHSYGALARGLTSGAAVFGLRFGISLATILLPTVLMGGTLPVLVRLVTRSVGEVRAQVAMLYSVNSAGAVAGCFLADFWWIPGLGLETTLLAGATMNLVAGLLAFMLDRRCGGMPGSAAEGSRWSSVEEEPYTVSEWRLAVIGAGISGFTAMLYEVVWTRMLGLAIGSSTHAFSIMLITFITGIAVGAGWVARWRKVRRSLDAFGWVELGLAGALLVSFWLYDLIPYVFARMAGLLARRSEAYPWYEFAQGLICFAVMIGPTLFLGMSLPLATRVATSDVGRTGRSVGTVFASNTLGTVVGAACTGLALVPWFGLASTFVLGIVLNAWLGLFALLRRRFFVRPGPPMVACAASLVVAFLFSGLFSSTWQRVFSLGLWRLEVPPSLAQFRAAANAMDLRYYRDGAGSSVSVDAHVSGGRTNLTLRVNGKEDAGTAFDMPTQILCAHVPLLLHPDPHDVLVVGLGSGITAGSALQHEALRQVDVVEISPEVVEAAELFSDFNHHVLDDPKCRVIVDDAKSYLRMTDRQYDVIVSEPSNPWMAGVATVFSREFYEQCRGALRPGGVMAQWVQVYETDDAVLRLVLNTFTTVFPQAGMWQPTASDLLLVSTLEPATVDLDQLERRLAAPAIRRDLRRIDIYRPVAFLAREIIPAGNLQHLIEPGGRVHSDFFPILEYVAQRAFFVRNQASLPYRYDENTSPRPTTLLGSYLRQQPLTEEDLRALTLFHLSYGLPRARLFRSILQRWRADYPESLEPLFQSLNNLEEASVAALETAGLEEDRARILDEAKTDPELLRRYGDTLYQAYRECRSAFHLPPTSDLKVVLERVAALDPQRQATCQLLLAELAWDRGDDAACLEMARPILEQLPFADPTRAPEPAVAATVLAKVIDSLVRERRYEEAWPWCVLAGRVGWLESLATPTYPKLSLLCRKVLAAKTGTERGDSLSGTDPRAEP